MNEYKLCAQCGQKLPAAKSIYQLVAGPVEVTWIVFACSGCQVEMWMDVYTGKMYGGIKPLGLPPKRPGAK